MEYKNIKPKRVWAVILIIVLALAAAITCFASAKPAGIYVDWARFGVYSTSTGVDNVVPAGSIVVTDRTVEPFDNTVAALFMVNGDSAYPDGTKSALVGALNIEDGQYTLITADGALDIDKERLETVVYYIGYIGTVLHIMYTYRYIVWGAWAAIFALVIILMATSGNRRLKRKRKQLTKIFEFYGEKYDAEEQDTDY
ncbi:MAG: hypothetical protein IKY46_05615 [Clostridia bacterium]|nr:hypothetical protein [Clostridia bacterium]